MTTTSTRRPAAGRRKDSTVTDTRPTLRRLRTLLSSPVSPYYLLIGSTAALVVIGLVMVLSASMITAYKLEGSSFAVFTDQAKYAVIGLVAAWIASRLPVRAWKRFAVPLLSGAILLQALVFSPLGLVKNGNRNWLRLPGVTLQPSELTKLGLILVGAFFLARHQRELHRMVRVIVPYLVPFVAVTIALVLAGHDLGTALVLLAIVAAVLFGAGVPRRVFAVAGAVAVAAVAFLVVTSGNRMGRITNWLSGSCTDPNGECGQSVHGLYALADGGWWGVGLGASKEKWAWLPEAHNDFIFAIIGEELGLPGTFVILALFALFATACVLLVMRSTDQFVRITTVGVMAWVLGQAMINIGAVIGLLPVIGVPLPFVSAGGSALVSTLVGVGVLVSCARHDPAARAILATRPSVVHRSRAIFPRRRSTT
ncbi:MAG: putative lipid II flippase FtsW [Dermatophilaceae bacterium]